MKPLTAERREEIAALADYAADGPESPMNTDMVAAMRDLLASESFWREAVKTSPMNTIFDGRSICNYCASQVQLAAQEESK